MFSLRVKISTPGLSLRLQRSWLFRQERSCGTGRTGQHTPSADGEAVPPQDTSQFIRRLPFPCYANTADHKKKKKISHLLHILPTMNLIPKSDFRDNKRRGKTMDPFHLWVQLQKPKSYKILANHVQQYIRKHVLFDQVGLMPGMWEWVSVFNKLIT